MKVYNFIVFFCRKEIVQYYIAMDTLVYIVTDIGWLIEENSYFKRN